MAEVPGLGSRVGGRLALFCIYRHQMCSFKFQMHQNPFSAGALTRTPVGRLMTLPQIPIRLGRGH